MVGAKSRILYPVKDIVDKGEGTNLVSKYFLKYEWDTFAKPIGDHGLR